MKISIIIPTYNHLKYVSRAIDSALLSLDFSGFEGEVIVVDDGSNDGTSDHIKEHSEIRYFRQENSGAASALNFGIQQATGDLISILNDDDLYLRHHVKLGVNQIRNSSLDFLIMKSSIFGYGTKLLVMQRHIDECENLIQRQGLVTSLSNLNWALSSSSFIFRSDVFYKLKGFRDLLMVHDWDFLLRSVQLPRVRMARSSVISWKYRCHSQNFSDKIDKATIESEMNHIRQNL